jgi:hypothetical protein
MFCKKGFQNFESMNRIICHHKSYPRWPQQVHQPGTSSFCETSQEGKIDQTWKFLSLAGPKKQRAAAKNIRANSCPRASLDARTSKTSSEEQVLTLLEEIARTEGERNRDTY